MNSPKVALIAYLLAVGFILAIAFHSPTKSVVVAVAPVSTTASDAK
jgi:hypothetical protein